MVQVALFSLVLLGEPLRWGGWLGAAVCLAGVALLATKGQRLTWAAVRQPAALYGLAAGGLLGLAAISIRAATKALAGGPVVVRAIIALAVPLLCILRIRSRTSVAVIWMVSALFLGET